MPSEVLVKDGQAYLVIHHPAGDITKPVGIEAVGWSDDECNAQAQKVVRALFASVSA